MSETPQHPILHGEKVTIRPLTRADVETLAQAIALDENAAPWWGDDPHRVKRWLTEERSVGLAIEADSTLAGVILYHEEPDPDYRWAGIDISVLSPYAGRGLGPDALKTLARHLFEERGHHRINIDPAAANPRAIRAYEKVGFRPVGIMRQYERGPDGAWRDGLLMDLLQDEFDG
ncbi:MAG: GNAT family protein [Coriobacteriia bacterium]|jgi:aminoglycoside 6'-N-acetyltransferase|nr:GNAT family protein [Coriobacteriia bacterium]